MSRLHPRTILLPLGLALLAALLLPAGAWAKSFSMPEARIVASVAPDGSLDVTEKRTFTFDGDFTRVYWVLDPPPGGEYSQITVSGPEGDMPPATEDGRPAGFSRVFKTGTMTQVEAYDTYSNETVTLTLHYRVTNAAIRWSDTSELYWQCVAPHWSVPTDEVQALILLPEGVEPGQVKAWAHGPLTGTVHIQDDASVLLEVSGLPASTFVEPRILFPAEALSQVPASTTPRLQKVLDEERDLAEQANAKRRQAAEEVARQRAAGLVMGLIGMSIPLLFLLAAIPLFLKYGREHRPSFEGEYFREDPGGLHPAIVSYLMNMGTVQDNALSASLMRLADRGAIRMEPVTVTKPFLLGTREESTYQLTLVREKWDETEHLDQSLLSFLFTKIAGDDSITIDEMKSEAKARPQEFKDGVDGFKSLVAQEADSTGLMEKGGTWARVLVWVMAFFAGGATFFGACAAENLLIGAVGGFCTLVLVVLASLMPRRSPEAAELFAKYRALRKYLTDFSRLHEAPPSSVILWNHFLVLAVVFGVADRVIEQLRVAVPAVVSDPGFATTYWWVASGPGYSSPVSALASGFSSASSIASSELSSSSGGGGGFSGGGGGGFGGGGGGGAD